MLKFTFTLYKTGLKADIITMNINTLTVLLQELAYQSKSKIMPATKAESVARVRDTTLAGTKMTRAASTGPAAERNPTAETRQLDERPLQPMAFTPLPLRSSLFREARFFAKVGEEKAGKGSGRETPDEIFICLITKNLGRIWVGLTCKKDYLSVKYFTDQKTANKILRENFPPMREELKTTGFTEVSITSQARAELGAVVEGLLPKFELHLLDRQI